MIKLKVTLDRIEGDYGILITEKKKKILWPEDELPDQAEGAVFEIDIKSNEEAQASQEKLAKAILNEILKEE